MTSVCISKLSKIYVDQNWHQTFLSKSEFTREPQRDRSDFSPDRPEGYMAVHKDCNLELLHLIYA